MMWYYVKGDKDIIPPKEGMRMEFEMKIVKWFNNNVVNN
jgi:hypothetical protein